ncbi:MAG: hypothetical protein ABWX90_03345 [Candidatus Saccharimonadales bacterium]
MVPRNYDAMFQEQPINYIGFWRSHSEPELPTPVASIYDNSVVIARLRDLQAQCEKWQSDYANEQKYRGISICRICNHGTGCSEYFIKQGDKFYCWPSGLIHYLEVHSIEPPQALREMLQYHELKWKITRENPKMELFPFNVHSNESSIVEIWNTHRPRGISWCNVSAQVQSTTQIRLIVRAAADIGTEVVYDEILTLLEEELADIVYMRKYEMAEHEYKERKVARREHEIKAILKEMFGE